MYLIIIMIKFVQHSKLHRNAYLRCGQSVTSIVVNNNLVLCVGWNETDYDSRRKAFGYCQLMCQVLLQLSIFKLSACLSGMFCGFVCISQCWNEVGISQSRHFHVLADLCSIRATSNLIQSLLIHNYDFTIPCFNAILKALSRPASQKHCQLPDMVNCT